MGFAEVVVNSPLSGKQTFSYAIPPGLFVGVGQAVWVPFGERLLQGIVTQLTDTPAVEETREIAGVIGDQPILFHEQIALAQWISGYYLSPLFDAVALMLPPGFERKTLTFLSAAKDIDQRDTSYLNQRQRLILEMLKGRDEVPLRELEKSLGKKEAGATVSQLVRFGLVARSYRLEPVRAKPKLGLFLSLAVSAEAAHSELENLMKKRAAKQAALLGFMAEQDSSVSWEGARGKTGCDRSVLNALAKRGLITLENVEVNREVIDYSKIIPSNPLTLTDAQGAALEQIKASLRRAGGDAALPDIFLLHGVTGSGKTEVYLQSLAEAVRLGKRGIALVPEISLTPQTIERFAARFPGRVAVLHSRLSLGEQFDEWRRIKGGGCDVVVGPRSALFAPQPDLGLIIIDEEHEWTYKQQDRSPYYHARDVAINLAGLTRSVVVMGSATPDVATYYRAEKGQYRLLSLPERVNPDTQRSIPLPQVHIVDMREELKAGNRGLLSRFLMQEMRASLDREEQVILFLNRRGTASFIQCRSCGLVLQCQRCQVALSYHSAEGVLVCHQCNSRMPTPGFCPRCHSRQISFFGAGSEKLEQEVAGLFPGARLLRWDSDTTKGIHAHETIANKFRAHEADILIGTQMVASGLDLPGVTLVGAVNADSGLNLPDFRAGERTFQLLSQVAGRAGRGSWKGKVIVQAYSPDNYAIQAAARHDYSLFYKREMGYRLRLRNPPMSRLVSLTYSHTNSNLCQKEAERVKRLLVQERDSRGTQDLSIIGPAPAYIQRLRGRFRWQLVIRCQEMPSFLPEIKLPRGWVVDVDPVGLT